ncbi:MAG: 4-(cytidine 5'-diphospho)-2-C-methyl-D-erythritol kinase [Clostridiales bacterium]|nr:4-(cytidine 5'-diphospho)-2-C-methyl-D-erythritol kinase [Clostridiales bacterium]
MKKVKLKAYAKINLTLDVGQKKDGYHPINSLVSSIDVCDEIQINKRSDRKITLTETGLNAGCVVTENNAYKTAKAFMEKYNTCGVDIIINKKIPVGGGLGGSSADIAGVLNGLKKLFEVDEDLSAISDALASDATYMLKGGYAVISDRGNTVKYIDGKKVFYLLLITNEKQILAKDSYRAFDELEIDSSRLTEKAVDCLLQEKTEEFFALLGNDLYLPSLSILPEMETERMDLIGAGAKASLMTGSGSVVYGVFEKAKNRNKAYKTLIKKYPNRLIKSKTKN